MVERVMAGWPTRDVPTSTSSSSRRRLVERDRSRAAGRQRSARHRSHAAGRRRAQAMTHGLRQPSERQARRVLRRQGARRRCRRSPTCASTPSRRELTLAPSWSPLAQGCDALIAYRQTAGRRGAVSRRCPRLLAFMRCAVDIRTVDVAAASRARRAGDAGERRASSPSVAEWIVGVMIDLGRGISRYAEAYHARPPRAAGHGPRAARLDAGRDRLRPDRPLPRATWRWPSACACVVHDAAADRRPRRAFASCALDALLAESDFVVCLAAGQRRDREPDERGRVRGDAAAALLHQCRARRAGRRSRAARRARRRPSRRLRARRRPRARPDAGAGAGAPSARASPRRTSAGSRRRRSSTRRSRPSRS